MKDYIKVKELKRLPESIPAMIKLNNQVWKEHIFYYLLRYYKETDNNEILQIIKHEKQKSIAHIEEAIKKHIKRWFRRDSKFNRQEVGILLDRETNSEGDRSGSYDFKFQHSYWNNRKSYFAFECKNLGKTKSMSLSRSINEYVYIKEKDREDGGIFRYFIDKYSMEQNFGGMIGFVIEKSDQSVIEKIISKIYSVYNKNAVGRLTKEKIIKNSIFGNTNTFDSIHLRQNSKTKQNEDFWLHHIIMDFVHTKRE